MTEKAKSSSSLTRFAAVNDDPRFKRQKKAVSKVKIDARFKEMFTGDNFVHPVRTDKYGRKKARGEEKEDLKKYYELEDEEAVSEEEQDVSSDADSSGSDAASESGSDYLMDQVMSSHPLVNRDVSFGEASARLAVVNMDWDQIRAVDILSFALAFKPPAGTIHSVKIYPSSFGTERLAVEAVSGPQPVRHEDDQNEDEVDEYKLRKYQLDRLKYYYAVIECDSADTAQAIYKACDGSEFEQSGNIVDLRYVPSDETFDGLEPKDVATMSTRGRYRGKTDMTTSALQNSSVKLTWDMDDPERSRATQTASQLSGLSKAQRRKLDLRDVDLAAYLASASSGDESDGNIGEYRQKLLGGSAVDVFGRESKEDAQDLKITFSSAFAGAGAEGGLGAAEREQTFDISEFKEGSDSASTDDELTVFQKEQLKRKQKKAEKRDKRKAQAADQSRVKAASAAELAALLKTSTATQSHFDLQEELEDSTKKSRRTGASKDHHVDIKDARFGAIYDEPAYAIDPSAASFKRTAGMQALLEERAKRRRNEE